VDRFVRRQNIERYKALLKLPHNDAEHERILKLLAEEQQKQLTAGDHVVDA
jgi:hypothetical protein